VDGLFGTFGVGVSLGLGALSAFVARKTGVLASTNSQQTTSISW
jgi:hypothetical protein